MKFAIYIHIIEDRIYESHFGADSFYVPFYTLTNTRVNSMMALLERMTEHKPSLRKHFLFSVFDTFSKFPPPSGWAFAEPYQRVGYPPLVLKGR